MSERRSGRSKKAVDYAKFAAAEENDDDFEEFKEQPKKRTNTKAKDESEEKSSKIRKPANKIESAQTNSQPIKSRLPLEEKVLQRQINQALEVSKTDIGSDKTNDSDAELSCGTDNSSDEDASSEDEFKPAKKQRKLVVPVNKKKASVIGSKSKVVKEEMINDPVDSKSSEETPKPINLNEKGDIKDKELNDRKSDDVKNDKSDHNDGQPSDESSSQSSDESSGEPTDESSGEPSEENTSDEEEFQPAKKQAKKENPMHKEVEKPIEKVKSVPLKKEANGITNLASSRGKPKHALKKVEDSQSDGQKTAKGNFTSDKQPSAVTDSTAKRKISLNSSSPIVTSRNITPLPSKGIRIGLSRKISRKPLHPGVKPQL